MFDSLFSESQSRIDKLQIVALCGLMIIGALFVNSATMVSEASSSAPIYNQLWFRQLIWYAAGTGAAVGLCMIDYRILA